MKQYQREYYLKNKEILIEKLKQKVMCTTCNRKLCIASYKRHLKCTYHLKRVNPNYIPPSRPIINQVICEPINNNVKIKKTDSIIVTF